MELTQILLMKSIVNRRIGSSRVKILFLVTEYDSANGICVQAVMKELLGRGHELTCLTNAGSTGKRRSVSSDIDVYLVRPRWVYALEKYIEKRRNDIMSVLLKKILIIMNKAKLVLSYPIWPLISPCYSLRYYQAAKKICKNSKFDMVVPVYSQIDTLIASKTLKRRFRSLMVVPYLLDAFSGGYGPRIFSQNWTENRGFRWENYLFRAATAIVAMESSREHYQRHFNRIEYAEKLCFLDIPLYRPTLSKASNRMSKDVNKILYIGSVKRGVRSPKYLIDVLSSLDLDNIELTFLGTDLKELRKMVPDIDRLKWVNVLPKVPHEEVEKFLVEADFLVNLGNQLGSMVPSKLFEYMSHGKPIISTVEISNDTSLRYLKKYPNGCVIDAKSVTMQENAKVLREFLMRDREELRAEDLTEVFLQNTPTAFALHVEELGEKYRQCLFGETSSYIMLDE